MKKGKKKIEIPQRNEVLLELGSTVTARFYEFQKIRISTYNRLRNLIFRKATGIELDELQDKKKKEYLKEFADKKLKTNLQKIRAEGKISEQDEQYISKIFEVLEDVEEKENTFKKLVTEIVVKEPIYTEFLQYVKGIGALLTATLLYYFHYCEKAKYPSSLWKFAGLTPDSKYVKGESSGFNKNCRMFMWRIGDSFIKQRTPRYRSVYDTEKTRQLKLMEEKTENAPKRPLHAELRARRKMVKKFLADYYIMAKTLTGQETSKPYIIGKLGHKHFDDVRVWLKQEKKKKLKKELGM